MSAVLPSPDHLDALVREVPGVDALYPAGSIVATVVNATLNAVAHRAPNAPLVLVEQRADGVRVTAKIGIGATESSSEVCARVHDALSASMLKFGAPPVEQIIVIVASVRLSV